MSVVKDVPGSPGCMRHRATILLSAEVVAAARAIGLRSGMAEITTLHPNRTIDEPLWRDVLGEELRRLRHDRGEVLGETAERAGVSPQYLSEMERGRKEPSSEMIAAVAGALDVTLVDLTLGVAERLVEPAGRPATRPGVLALAA